MANNMSVQLILALGFVVLGNPKHFAHFYQGWGSVGRGKAVTLSEVEQKRDPAGDAHDAVFVTFKAWSEAGEDLCDYHTEESRWVRVDKLQEYLEGKGIRFNKEENYA